MNASMFPQYSAGSLVACPDCDLLQRLPAARSGAATLGCARCGATLRHAMPRSLELSTAFTVAAAVMFAIGNAFPIMTLRLQGRSNSVTLLGMSAALQGAGMGSVAALILLTVVLMPALELAALLYLLVPVVALRRVPRQLASASRVLEAVKPWAMLEVLMLAVLVSMGRIEKVGPLTLGTAFWS